MTPPHTENQIRYICITESLLTAPFSQGAKHRMQKLTRLSGINEAVIRTNVFNFSEFKKSKFSDLLSESVVNCDLAIFEYACGFRGSSELEEFSWSQIPFDVISIEFLGLGKLEESRVVRQLKSHGYIGCGIGLRESGTDRLFVPHQDFRSNVESEYNELRRNVGRKMVVGRNKTKRIFAKTSRKRSALETDGVRPSAITVLESEAALAQVLSTSNTQISLNVPLKGRAAELADECYRKFGVRPISFSFPEKLALPQAHPVTPISSVIPGLPYSYETPEDYMRQYSEAALAITHRKAGWDCFRHVEILAAGSVPLMLDSEIIPKFSMAHYPKTAMSELLQKVLSQGGVPSLDTREAFNSFYRENLSTKSMANYILSSARLENSEKILFYDRSLSRNVDYQSVFTLIGLKELLGSECHVPFPVGYIYVDWEGPVTSLYGRGFGYTKILNEKHRSLMEPSNREPDEIRGISWDAQLLSQYDAVIVGNIERNFQEARDLLNYFPADRTVWIHGEDDPPSKKITSAMRESGTNSFVRAINAE